MDRSSVRFPALLFMGPPHSGKSVLAYLLTRALRQRDVAHFLLRTAPDGEGDWFYEGASETTRLLRLSSKKRYTRALVHQMIQILRHRHLPLLVDIGGKPQGQQWDILNFCTHGILLYRTQADLDIWMPKIRRAGLRLLAVLESRRRAQESLTQTTPYIQGVISGLERRHPRTGPVFQALLQRVQELFSFSEADLEDLHRQSAPYPMVSTRQLAQALGKPKGAVWWHPEDLPRVLRHLPKGPIALYGRGPTWLAAAIAAAQSSYPMALFDAHFGWIHVPEVHPTAPMALRWEDIPLAHEWLLAVARPSTSFLEYGKVVPPPLPENLQGVLLFGKLPLWIYAALARFLVQEKHLAVAVWEPRHQQAIGVTAPILGQFLQLSVMLPSTQPPKTHAISGV